MSSIIFGLNPAWQKIINLDSFTLHGVNRAASVNYYASGKGVNCIRVLMKLGGEGTLVQFAGGHAGKRILKELRAAGVKNITREISLETRTCTTIISGGRSTEIIDPSPTVTTEDVEKLSEEIIPILSSTSRIIICGTYPQGVGETFFSFLSNLSRGVEVILDGARDVEPILRRGVDLLKINRNEFKQLSGYTDFRRGWEILRDRYSINDIIVTGGDGMVCALIDGSLYELSVPEIDNPVNVIGSGDSFLAGWLYGTECDIEVPERLKYSIAVAVSSCMAEKPWELLKDDVDRFYSWQD